MNLPKRVGKSIHWPVRAHEPHAGIKKESGFVSRHAAIGGLARQQGGYHFLAIRHFVSAQRYEVFLLKGNYPHGLVRHRSK